METSEEKGQADTIRSNPLQGGERYYFSTPEERAAMEPYRERLARDGYVIIQDQLSPRHLDELAAEFDRLHASTMLGDGEFAGYNSKRVYNILAKSSLLNALVLHPTPLAMAEAHLDDQILLSTATSVELHPGETPQTLHRDDDYYPIPRPHLPLSLSTMWALDDFTEENGATRIVPGSHQSTVTAADAHQSIPAEMPRGSVMLWDGSLLHGGGGNHSQGRRLGLIVLYIRAWLRAQDNMYLGIPGEVVRGLPRRLQYLMGYWVVNNFLGMVNNHSPLRALR